MQESWRRAEGNILAVAEVDIVDGTPLLDVKPYAPAFDCRKVKRSRWLDKTRKSRRIADNRFGRANDKE